MAATNPVMRNFKQVALLALFAAGCSTAASPDAPSGEAASTASLNTEMVNTAVERSPQAAITAAESHRQINAEEETPPPIADVYIGGAVGGYESHGLILINNDSMALWINGNGEFKFRTPIFAGEAYNVTIRQQPSDGSRCTVYNGSGIADESVNDVIVTCAPPDVQQ